MIPASAFQVGPFQPFPAYQQIEDEEEVVGGAATFVIRRRPDDERGLLAAIAAFLEING